MGDFVAIHQPQVSYFTNAGITQGAVVNNCLNAKAKAIMSQFQVPGKSYAEVDMNQSTYFYMNYPGMRDEYRHEYCSYSGFNPDECKDLNEDEMVEKVWGGIDKALQTKYRVSCGCEAKKKGKKRTGKGTGKGTGASVRSISVPRWLRRYNLLSCVGL